MTEDCAEKNGKPWQTLRPAGRQDDYPRLLDPPSTQSNEKMTWRPMSTAKKNGKPLLLRMKDPVPLAEVDFLRGIVPWNGATFVGSHPGVREDDFYDPGWRVHHGSVAGFSDDWFVGWMPLPE